MKTASNAVSKAAPVRAQRPASIFRNGRNQAVRLPQELRFPDDVRQVMIRKEGESLVLIPQRKSWTSFFALRTKIPRDFLADRDDPPPQTRTKL